jgi:hypothetical protein
MSRRSSLFQRFTTVGPVVFYLRHGFAPIDFLLSARQLTRRKYIIAHEKESKKESFLKKRLEFKFPTMNDLLHATLYTEHALY